MKKTIISTALVIFSQGPASGDKRVSRGGAFFDLNILALSRRLPRQDRSRRRNASSAFGCAWTPNETLPSVLLLPRTARTSPKSGTAINQCAGNDGPLR